MCVPRALRVAIDILALVSSGGAYAPTKPLFQGTAPNLRVFPCKDLEIFFLVSSERIAPEQPSPPSVRFLRIPVPLSFLPQKSIK